MREGVWKSVVSWGPGAEFQKPVLFCIGKQNYAKTAIEMLLRYIYIRTHGSGSYVGLASWAWFLIECFKTVTKHCLYLPAHI